ncbi:50S ribosomal protein L30 [Candidatus Woesearchaeota archaeon]|nr:50S ribosomal protein L30 [Candidatus Woesearchaeota archaeon]
MKRIAVVRVRGECKIKQDVEDTLKMLRLYRKNSCVVIPNTLAFTGMLTKVKDFITWGDINETTFKNLITKRGKLPGKKPLTEQYMKEKISLGFDDFTKEFFNFKKELKDVPGLKLFFKLHPPMHGFERKGVKKQFSMGGALGYRKEKINDLLMRMI